LLENEEEESEGASQVRMGDEEGGKNCGEFGAFKYMFYGEGKIETTIRAGEGHEISEEVSVNETGMSCMKPGKSNFKVLRGLVR